MKYTLFLNLLLLLLLSSLHVCLSQIHPRAVMNSVFPEHSSPLVTFLEVCDCVLKPGRLLPLFQRAVTQASEFELADRPSNRAGQSAAPNRSHMSPRSSAPPPPRFIHMRRRAGANLTGFNCSQDSSFSRVTKNMSTISKNSKRMSDAADYVSV